MKVSCDPALLTKNDHFQLDHLVSLPKLYSGPTIKSRSAARRAAQDLVGQMAKLSNDGPLRIGLIEYQEVDQSRAKDRSKKIFEKHKIKHISIAVLLLTFPSSY